jgi:hypothetical protein
MAAPEPWNTGPWNNRLSAMPLLTFTSLVFLGSFLAGLLGALTGLGGGVVLIPAAHAALPR